MAICNSQVNCSNSQGWPPPEGLDGRLAHSEPAEATIRAMSECPAQSISDIPARMSTLDYPVPPFWTMMCGPEDIRRPAACSSIAVLLGECLERDAHGPLASQTVATHLASLPQETWLTSLELSRCTGSPYHSKSLTDRLDSSS